MSFATKKLINKRLREAGAKAFDVSAVNALAEHVRHDNDALDCFIRAWKADGAQGDRLTLEGVEAVLAQLSGSREAVDLSTVVNAFEVPKISYDAVGRKLYEEQGRRSIFARAGAKQQMYIDRLHLISQRIHRNELFQPKSLTSVSDAPFLQLSDIQSLKGMIGARKVVLACISRAEDGRYTLEDHSGSVPLNLSEAQTAAGFFTENCIVIAEGEMHMDGVFHACAVGFPPCEAREGLPMAAQRLNFFGGPALSLDDSANLAVEESGRHNDRLLVLANVHLDRRDTLDALNRIFSIYSDNVEELPTMIVLMGNFHSKSASSSGQVGLPSGDDADFASIRDAFDSLAALLEQYPRVQSECKFVFVPGPGDPSPSVALPQPPLPAFLTAEVRRVLPTAVFASNPCRVRYLSREIVFFRYDILARMRRHCLIAPKDSDGWLAGTQATQATQAGTGATQASVKAMWGHLTMTLLQQSHLCPLPLVQQPIYWQYDNALSLYPLPHAAVVADCSPQAQYTHQGCTVFNPGSFAEGLFAAYKPVSGEVEENEVPRGDFVVQDAAEFDDGDVEDVPEYDGGADAVSPAPCLDTARGDCEVGASQGTAKKLRVTTSPAAASPDAGGDASRRVGAAVKASSAGGQDGSPRDARMRPLPDQGPPGGADGAAGGDVRHGHARGTPFEDGDTDDDDGVDAHVEAVLARRRDAGTAGQTDQEMWDAMLADGHAGGGAAPHDDAAEPGSTAVGAGAGGPEGEGVAVGERGEARGAGALPDTGASPGDSWGSACGRGAGGTAGNDGGSPEMMEH